MTLHAWQVIGTLAWLIAGTPLLAQVEPSTPPNRSFDIQVVSSAYRLGSGDRINITVLNVPEFSGPRVVLPDGTISLPIVGTLRVEGLTTAQLEERLGELYRPYVKNLSISAIVEAPRPVNVSVLGEVNRPGPYTLSSQITGGGMQMDTPVGLGTGSGISTGPGSRGLTVSQALRLAGGITEVADIENIMLVRPLPDGQKVRRRVNLWALFQDADTTQDLPLLDGDALLIPRAQSNKPGYDVALVNNSSLAPSTVEVKVLGEVKRPGLANVAPNAPFSDAIVAAGGATNYADWKRSQLIRLNPDGSVSRWEIAAILEQGRDPEKNPPLRRGDLVIVPRSLGGDVVSTLNDAGGTLNLIGNLIFLVRNLTRF